MVSLFAKVEYVYVAYLVLTGVWHHGEMQPDEVQHKNAVN